MLHEIKAKFSKMRTMYMYIAATSVVGDQSMVHYCYTLSENPTISCPIVEVLVKRSEVFWPLSGQPMKG